MTKVYYIGQKAVKRDTVAGTGSRWNGHGDAVDVPDDAAEKLLKHPDVWSVVDPNPGSLPVTEPGKQPARARARRPKA